MTAFNFCCFGCQAILRAKTKLCGSTVTCPKCGAALIVPDYSPPVSAPSAPATNVFQPNLPITVDDDDDGSIIGQRRKRRAMSGRDIGSMFFTVLGAVSFVVLAYILLMQNDRRTGANINDAVKGGVSILFLLVFACVALLFYLIPSFIAYFRGHPNFAPILTVNLLLGWLVIGWIVALVWSLTEVKSRDHHHYYHHQS